LKLRGFCKAIDLGTRIALVEGQHNKTGASLMYTSKKILSLILNMFILSACGAMPEASSALNKVGSSAEQEDAIRNGEPISREEYPEVGTLVSTYSWYPGYYESGCTGTLIAPDVVLTAAHCIPDDKPDGPRLVGFSLDHDISDFRRPDHFVEIDAVIMHPEYSEGSLFFSDSTMTYSFADLALLRLAAPIELPHFTPVLQEDSELFSSFPVLTSVGYGTNDSISNLKQDIGSGVKRKANLGLHGPVNGKQNVEGAPVYQNAAVVSVPLVNTDAITCTGDSGGPIFATLEGTQYIVGVLSGGFTELCVDDFASVHTNPVAFYTWIEDTLDDFAHPWNNPRQRLDVNADGVVTPIDALMVINQLNDTGAMALSDSHLERAPLVPYIDTNGDNYVTPIDALIIINHLNSGTEAKTADVSMAEASVETSVETSLEAQVSVAALAAFFDGDRSKVDLAFDEFTYAFDQDNQFLSGSDYALNFGGRNGKWLHSETLGWTFIIPDGRLYEFISLTNGQAEGKLITTLMPRHYTNPSLIHSPANPDIEQVADRLSISISGY